MKHAVCLAVCLTEEGILDGAVRGHTSDPDGNPGVLPSRMLPKSAVATGATLTISTANLERPIEVLMNQGRSHDGKQVLAQQFARLNGAKRVSTTSCVVLRRNRFGQNAYFPVERSHGVWSRRVNCGASRGPADCSPGQPGCDHDHQSRHYDRIYRRHH